MERKEMLKQLEQMKNKLMGAVAMLLVAAILMGSTSYAWFVLSTAPEVADMRATAGANGALEIALQSTNAEGNGRADITSAVGSSIAKVNTTVSNTYWGNVVDLSSGYGLEHITLFPSRLKVSATEVEGQQTYSVDPSTILTVPQFGTDGRVVSLRDASKTAYDEASGKFEARSNWGVNVLGAVKDQGEDNTVTLTYAREIVLNQAREKVAAYRTDLRQKMSTTIAENSLGIMGMMISTANGMMRAQGKEVILAEPDNTYAITVKAYVAAMNAVAADAADAVRWALLANAAADETHFNSDNEEEMRALGQIYASCMQLPLTAGEGDSVQSIATTYGYTEIADAAAAMATAVARVKAANDLIVDVTDNDDNRITEAGMMLVVNDQTFMYGSHIANKNDVDSFLDALKYDLSPGYDNQFRVVSEDTVFTVADDVNLNDTNLFSAIATVIGDYSGVMNVWSQIEEVEFTNEEGLIDYQYVSKWVDSEPVPDDLEYALAYTIQATSKTNYNGWSTDNIGALGEVSNQIEGIRAPGTVQVAITRSDVTAYGYSVDLAFQSSESANLLLQQEGVNRVDSDISDSTQGAGSTVSFTVAGDMTDEQIQNLLQGIYIVFMNTSTGAVYKVAAVDPASIEITWTAIPATATATLALYEPSFAEDGTLSLGSRVTTNVITAMTADTPYYISTVVYLCGDKVDSSMFSASQGLSLDGAVNLQFASSANLTAMNYPFSTASEDAGGNTNP